jgi:hypothetical protein
MLDTFVVDYPLGHGGIGAMLLMASLLSPVLAAVAVLLVFLYAKARSLPKPSAGFLLGRSFLYAIVGAVASLLLTVVWIVWYEWSSGFSAGNGPLAWIFGYGPLSVALGQFIALGQWWFRKGG